MTAYGTDAPPGRNGTAPEVDFAIVIPTLGRPSLHELLGDLAVQTGPRPREIVVVDDRPDPTPPIDPGEAIGRWSPVRVVAGLGRGPAAARNLGGHLVTAQWVAYLDDDVRVAPDWSERLAADLADLPETVAGSQATLTAPLPTDRRPTDWERSTAGLEHSHWITADMAFRRAALLAVDGFDERFPRAYREDADLALRLRGAGWHLVRGERHVTHPVRPATRGTSLRVQRGNADDALMRRLHGPRWREAAQAGRGRFRWHLATVGAAAAAATTALALAAPGVRSRRGRMLRRVAGLSALTWLGLTTDFARRRIAPGPRTAAEVTEMAWTSAAIPAAAVWHRIRGEWRHRHAKPWPPPLRAVLFDRDGTLVHDVPYNGDPSLVEPVPQAGAALRRVRADGLLTGVVSNQSGVARGLLSHDQVAAVNAEIDGRLGPFDTWQVCPHGPDDGCACRKPAPGLVLAAARELGVRPEECAVIGDIGSDVLAARAAGARAVLVPTAETLPDETADAPWVAPSLEEALDLLRIGGAS
ncbi:MAG TPA: HAD-IIIA family hydrolase [Intrasporangium sp.]|nr:HAD-IIIA family hydrolase [Intrasporangium sp.]